jgi:hypothetical protein
MPDGFVVERGEYSDLVKLPNGKLKISLTDQGHREFDRFQRISDKFGIDAAIRELLQDHLCGTWEEVFPEEIGALTSAMLITDDVERDDDGRITAIGPVYWNPYYAVMDEMRELRERSCLVLASA